VAGTWRLGVRGVAGRGWGLLLVTSIGTGGQALMETRLSSQDSLDIRIVRCLLKLSSINSMAEGINYSNLSLQGVR